MIPTIHSKPHIFVIACICLYSFMVWWPTRSLPYHWDSAAFYINATKFLYDHNFSPLIAPGSEFAHPPLFPLLTALAWKLLGISFLTTHLVIFPFLPILLLATYFLGVKLGGFRVAIAATMLTATMPFVLAEYGLPYIDLPAGALAALSLTLWFYHRPRWAILTFSLAVLIKFTVIILIFYFLFSIRTRKTCALFLVPCLLIVFWLLYHHQITGWWLTLPGRITVLKLSPVSFFNSLKFVYYVFFIRQFRFLPSLIILYFLLIRYKKFPQIRLLGFICFSLLIFALTGEFIPRYAIFLLPAYTVICAQLIYTYLKPPFHHLSILVILLFFVSIWHSKIPPTQGYTFRLNEDLSYQDHIAVGHLTAQYLETHFPQTPIYGSFPQNYQLTQPWQGYVTKPLNFQECDNYRTERRSAFPTILFYIHPYHYTQIQCQELLKQLPHQLLQQFVVNGVWAQIYEIN